MDAVEVEDRDPAELAHRDRKFDVDYAVHRRSPYGDVQPKAIAHRKRDVDLVGIERDTTRYQRDLVETVGASRAPPDPDLEARLLPGHRVTGCEPALIQAVFTPMAAGFDELYEKQRPNILYANVPDARISPRNLRLRRESIARRRHQAHQPAPPSHIARDRSQAPFEAHRDNNRPAPRVRAPVHFDGGVGHGAPPTDDPALRHRNHEGPAFAGCGRIAFEAGRCGWTGRRSEPIRRSVLDQPGDGTRHHRRARTDSNDDPHHVAIASLSFRGATRARFVLARPGRLGPWGCREAAAGAIERESSQ